MRLPHNSETYDVRHTWETGCHRDVGAPCRADDTAAHPTAQSTAARGRRERRRADRARHAGRAPDPPSAMASLAPLDLTPAQSRALRTISKNESADPDGRAGIHPGRRPPLGHRPGRCPGGSRGWSSERVDPANRRSVLVTLTEQGRDRQHAMSQARAAAGDGLFGALTPDERRRCELLGRVQNAARLTCPTAGIADPGLCWPTTSNSGPTSGLNLACNIAIPLSLACPSAVTVIPSPATKRYRSHSIRRTRQRRALSTADSIENLATQEPGFQCCPL